MKLFNEIKIHFKSLMLQFVVVRELIHLYRTQNIFLTDYRKCLKNRKDCFLDLIYTMILLHRYKCARWRIQINENLQQEFTITNLLF